MDRICAIVSAPTADRQSTASIHKRAGTRISSNPGKYMSSAYGPLMPSGRPSSDGRGPSVSSHISSAAKE